MRRTQRAADNLIAFGVWHIAVDALFLAIAVSSRIGSESRAELRAHHFGVDAIYASRRLNLPFRGLLVIGY